MKKLKNRNHSKSLFDTIFPCWADEESSESEYDENEDDHLFDDLEGIERDKIKKVVESDNFFDLFVIA